MSKSSRVETQGMDGKVELNNYEADGARRASAAGLSLRPEAASHVVFRTDTAAHVVFRPETAAHAWFGPNR